MVTSTVATSGGRSDISSNIRLSEEKLSYLIVLAYHMSFHGNLWSRIVHCGARAATDEKARALFINELRQRVELRTTG